MSNRSQSNQQEDRISSFAKNTTRFAIGVVIFVLGISIVVISAKVFSLIPPDKVEWTGFNKSTETTKSEKAIANGKETTITTKEVSEKTLWDWLSLLGAPASLAILGFWLQRLQNNRASAQAQREKNIAEDNEREEILQNYLDRLSVLEVLGNKLTLK
jgi:hypothetical protein